MGKYIRGRVDEVLGIGTLAAKTLITQVFDETVDEETLVSSIVASYSVIGATPGTDVGPLQVGIAHSDYTSAEIEEYIENTGSWSRGNLVQSKEIGNRLIRSIGVFAGAGSPLGVVQLNDGVPIKTKLNWNLVTGQTLELWGYNLGTSAFATTSPQVHADGYVNMWAK